MLRNATQALPAKSLEEIRTIGPRLMLQIAAILGAVIRRCNAVLSGGLVGVDALGEKVSSAWVVVSVTIERPG